VCSNLVFSVSKATPYHFGILSSSMHNAFMRTIGGRLKSDYRYSNSIVYNNFPYPFMANVDSDKAQKARESIAKAAQGVLDAREHYQDGSDDALTLAQLYNTYLIDPYPLLTKAHKALDKAVDNAYGYRGKGDDASRVEFLIKKTAELDA
ncbi:MAG: class I SAM-dependent DNA methyltransferase, partial [Streptococcus pyogenes]